ncbi:DUF3575 domain-containing protein [uncultured Parabacteroides sp.]|uniref:DUF3575 domain-containing protein n=1 Tax=uncultured Parabacteroides sp. TaxID=512312 RepID=UPI00261560DF|nr:DUF3575 domain-containing protein [uncultured Parabacteroides sp.]
MTKRLLLTGLLCVITSATLLAQTALQEDQGAVVGIKTNALYWSTTTPNLGLEFRLARHWSLDLEAGLNPFSSKRDDGSFGRSIKHFRLHPEARYWFCEAFDGHFLGLHVPYLIYNVSDIKWLGTENGRHQGWGTGAGISYGYSWVLGRNWNVEASLGVGYLYLESEKYPCANCGTKTGTAKKHYFGPTQAAVSAIYLF